MVLLLPLLLAPLVDSNSDASTFPILRFDHDGISNVFAHESLYVEMSFNRYFEH